MSKRPFAKAAFLAATLLIPGCTSLLQNDNTTEKETTTPVDPSQEHIGTRVIGTDGKEFIKVANFKNSNCGNVFEEHVKPDLSHMMILSCKKMINVKIPTTTGDLIGHFEQYSWEDAKIEDIRTLILYHELMDRRRPDAGHDKIVQKILTTWENMNKEQPLSTPDKTGNEPKTSSPRPAIAP